jgi:hypothetical protein
VTTNINIWVIVVAPFVSFATVLLMYAPKLVIPNWDDVIGIDDERYAALSNWGGVASIVRTLIVAIGLGYLVDYADIRGFGAGIWFGTWVGAAFAVSIGAEISIYRRGSIREFARLAVLEIVFFAVIAGMHASWT